MAVGVPLSTLVDQLRAEIGASTNVAQGVNSLPLLQQSLRRTQERLYQEIDWPHLIVERDKNLSTGQRYYSFDPSVNRDRVLNVFVKTAGNWSELSNTFEPFLFNKTDSDAAATANPVNAWRIYEGNQIEIWPAPADSTQTLRVRAIRNLNPLLANSDTCDLDSTLLIMFAAADMLARLKSPEAQPKMQAAVELFNAVKKNVLKTPTYIIGNGSLAELTDKVIAELGDSNRDGIITAATVAQTIRRTQDIIYNDFDWPFLVTDTNHSVSANTRYLSLDAAVNANRIVDVFVKSGSTWQKLSKGVDAALYGQTDSDAAATGTIVNAWRQYGTNQIELWPIPSGAVTIKVRHVRKLNPLVRNSDTAELDQTAIVLTAAADLLQKLKSPDFEYKSQAAQAYYASVKAKYAKDEAYQLNDGSLEDLIQNLKAEIGDPDLESKVNRANLTQLLRRTQDTIYNQFDWPFLITDTNHTAAANTRYLALDAAVNPTRIVDVFVKSGTTWQKLSKGIDATLYAQTDSEASGTGTIVNAWRQNGTNQIELWPVPSGSVTIKVRHVRKLTALVKNSDKCELDKNLIVLTAAAELMAKLNLPDVELKRSAAQANYAAIIAKYSKDEAYQLNDGSLEDLIQNLKAEIGDPDLESKVSRASLTQLIRRTQERLYNDFDWPFLINETDQSISSGAASGVFSAAINPRRIIAAYVKNGSVWEELGDDFTTNLYNNSDPATTTGAPIRAWRSNGAGGFEVWPKPSTTQTLRFRHVRVLTPLVKNSDKCELDKNLIVVTAAAELMAKLKLPDAELKQAAAQEYLNSLKKNQNKVNTYLLNSNSMRELTSSVAYECGLDDDSMGQYVPMIRQILMRTQTKLYQEYNWPSLIAEWDQVTTANTRYYTFPASLNPERILAVYAKYSQTWNEIQNGFRTDVYNFSNADAGATSQPILLWRRYSVTQYEVWPMPADNQQTIRFRYIKNLDPFLNNNDSATLDRDLLVLFASAELASRLKLPDAQGKLALAQAHYRSLRANSMKQPMFIMGNGIPKTDRGDWVIKVNPV